MRKKSFLSTFNNDNSKDKNNENELCKLVLKENKNMKL